MIRTYPNAATTSQAFGAVEAAIEARLSQRAAHLNHAANIIAAGRISTPTASSSNPLTASVSSYSPAPGRQLSRSMYLNVQNHTGRDVDSIADALQRYLDIRPRREASSDPLDEDSIARHPQQLVEAGSRWRNELFNQFAANGLSYAQHSDNFKTWSGRLGLKINDEGAAHISAPESRSPLALGSQSPAEIRRQVALSAQRAFSQMPDPGSAVNHNYIQVGAPNYSQTALGDPVTAAPTALKSINTPQFQMPTHTVGAPNMAQTDVANPITAASTVLNTYWASQRPVLETYTVGAPNYSQTALGDPVTAAPTALKSINTPQFQMPTHTVGQPSYNDNQNNDPDKAWRQTAQSLAETLSAKAAEHLTVGRPAYTDDIYSDPLRSSVTTTQVNLSLQGDPLGGAAQSYKSLALEQPYIRAIRALEGLNAMSGQLRLIGAKA